MTVLFITRKFPPSTGGMETFAYDLSTALGKSVDLKLIAWSGSNKYLPLVLPYLFIRACFSLISGHIDIIHMQDGVLAPLGYALSLVSRRPFVVVIHGLDITFKNKIFQTINVSCVRQAKIAFCISQAAADEATQRGVSQSKVRVIPLAVADKYHAPKEPARQKLRQTWQLSDDTPILLTVGRLVKRKGVAWFTENVLPELVKKYPKLIYAVGGEGAEREPIEAAVTRKKLDSHVKLLSHIPDEDMPMIYNGADIFVQPNITVDGNIEGFGLVVLEASLCELPTVATGIEGIKDAVTDGENGILLPEKSVPAFTHAIDKFLGDQTYAYRFGQKSRSYTLKHYQWPSITKQYVTAYQELTDRK